MIEEIEQVAIASKEPMLLMGSDQRGKVFARTPRLRVEETATSSPADSSK
jgi:sigma54-dependent transcription regulator